MSIEKQDTIPTLKERKVVAPEELSARQISKTEMADERSQLAAEIIRERKEARDKIAELRVRASLLDTKLQGAEPSESSVEEADQLETTRTERANSLTERFENHLHTENGLMTETERIMSATDLTESMNHLVDADSLLKSIRGKIASHYGEALGRATSRVEQTMLRNNAFLVHVMLERDPSETPHESDLSFEDKLDIILSLEPSIATSSVIPGTDDNGKVSGIWGMGEQGGLLVGGGRISAASSEDFGSYAESIKSRSTFGGSAESLTDIDTVVQAPKRARVGEHDTWTHNEIIVDNPEVLGYFKPGFMDDKGSFLIGVPGMYADGNAENIQQAVDGYQARFAAMREKGLPFFAMTPDRHFFEVLRISNDGSMEVGEEYTPEQAAKSPAGMRPEIRKTIGRKLLEKDFAQGEEARGVVSKIIEEIE